jgi:hypothetical protein
VDLPARWLFSSTVTALQLLWDYEKNITDPAGKKFKDIDIEKI